MHNIKLIGLAGKSGSGKSTAAALLKTCYPSVQEYAFASPLKAGVAAMFNIPVWTCYDELNKQLLVPGHNFTLRQALQIIGTEVARTLDPNIWITQAEKTISTYLPNTMVIISDVRFNNEAKWIKDNGGILIRFVREPDTKLTVGEQSHTSEAGVDANYVDTTIANIGTKLELKNKLITYLESKL